MTYEKVKNLKSEEFKRLCGVHPETFSQMAEVVRARSKTKLKTGRPGKLSMEDQLLMTLEYWREYRTYFHIGQSWGVNEQGKRILIFYEHRRVVWFTREENKLFPQ